MLKWMRPSPAMVVAVISLLVSLSGAAYAGMTVSQDSIGSKELKRGAVKTGNVRDEAVTPKKLAHEAVEKSKIRKKAVDTAQLSSDSVNASKIQAGTIQPEHLSPTATVAGPQGPTGPTGPQGPAGAATAYAMVAVDGTLVCSGTQSTQCSNIAPSNVTRLGTGLYCFYGLGFTPKSIMAVPADKESFIRARLVLAGSHTDSNACTAAIPSTQAVVATDAPDQTSHNETFYVWFQ